MAFNSNVSRAEYIAATGQTVFPFVFKVFEQTDVKVYLTPTGQISDDSSDLLQTGYTVSINGDAGGSVTFSTPTVSGDKVTLLRSLPVVRNTDYQENGDLRASTLDIDQDYQTYLVGDLSSRVDKVVKFPESAQGLDGTLPSPSADNYIRWNSTGTALVNDTEMPSAVLLAKDWANKAEDSVVADGEYSAKHYSLKAEDEKEEATTQAGIATQASLDALQFRNEAEQFNLSKPFVIEVIEDLNTIHSSYTTAIVKELNRGGIFIWSATGVSNSGTVFAGTTGFWHRYYYGAVNVKWFGAKGNGVNDDRQAIQNTIDYLVNTSGGGEIYIPKGSYLIGSIVSPDTIRNGLLLQGTTEFSTNNSIRLVGEGNESILIAKDNDMCIIRNARVYTNIENIKIDGNNKLNVIGIGLLAEDIESTTTLTSNSYFTFINSFIENCSIGMRMKPGETVAGSDAGCFYHNISNIVFNLNTEHLKLEKDLAGYNRVTRSAFSNCIFTRGNSGVNILGGTELSFINCSYELIDGIAFYYGDTNPANISIFGGYAEACTKGLTALEISAPYINVYGYHESMTHDNSYAYMNRSTLEGLNIPQVSNSAINLAFGNAYFASIIADIDRTNSKTLSFTANGTEIFRTSQYNNLLVGAKVDDGLSSKLQVVGNISHKGGQVSLTSDSATYEIVNRGSVAKEFQWYVGAGGSVPIAKLTTAGTWTNASDIRIKKDIKDIKYGLDTILKLSPKSYKLKQDDSEKIGFIAQEIKDIIPEVVYGKDDDFLTLDYASMVSILVKAVQEQQQQINLLKQKIGE